MGNKFRCIREHFTSEEYDGKNCPYDNISAKELSEMLTVDVPEQKEREQYRQVMSGNSVKTKQLTSIVMDRISTVKRQLKRNGFAIITVNTWDKKYYIRLYGEDKDYDYDILSEEYIDD